MTRETNDHKQELLFVIGQNEQDLKFANGLLAILMKDSDVHKVRQRSVWNENTKDWQIPSFILTDKKAAISFPTINGKQRVD